MKKRRILICVLDWGLGHATRCMPIIRYSTGQGAEVFIGSSGDALQLLKEEFPTLTFFQLPSYNIRYSAGASQVWTIIRQLGKIRRTIREERKIVEQLVNEYSIDKIISDNRYGCYNAKAHSVIITHQTGLLMPLGLGIFGPLAHRWIRKKIAHFNECWIPDTKDDNNLSGKLSHRYSTGIETKFIGPLTRFAFEKSNNATNDVLAILSGPEPQRSILEKKLLEQFVLIAGKKFILIAGKVGEGKNYYINENIRYISSLPSDELNKLVSDSEVIICRSGYSSIMDLHRSSKKIIFVPTPGQTEQEYLAAYLARKNVCIVQEQVGIDLEKVFKQLAHTEPFYFNINPGYKEALQNMA